MKRTLVMAAAGALLAHAAGSASACDMCAIYRAEDVGAGAAGWRIGVAEQFTRFGTLQLDGTKVPNETDQKLDSSITQLILSYPLSPRFGVQLDLPYIHRSFRRPAEEGIERGTEAGIGDASALAYGTLYEHLVPESTFAWNVLGGIKLPTGSPDRLDEELAEAEPLPGQPESGIHGHDLALGSGSCDGILGTGFVLRWKRLLCSGAAQYFLRTQGHLDYRCANELDWNVKPGAYLWLSNRSTLALRCAVHGEQKGKDAFRGEVAADTRMDAVLMGPEVDVTWQDHLSMSFGVDFPVDIDNSALQLVPDYKVYAALTWRP
jgi:hypothetical protein